MNGLIPMDLPLLLYVGAKRAADFALHSGEIREPKAYAIKIQGPLCSPAPLLFRSAPISHLNQLTSLKREPCC